jgi:hypothetical protein
VSGRDITPEASAAGAAEVVSVLLLALFEFDTGPVRITSAPYDVPYDLNGDGDSELWLTTLGLGTVTGAEEGTETQSYGITCKLSGIPQEAVSLALQENPQGRQAYFWLAFLDADHRIIPSPVLIFAGRMDTMPIEIGSTAELTLSVESRLADWDRVRGGRYTDAEQQRRSPGDRFFQFTAQAVDKELTWGKA